MDTESKQGENIGMSRSSLKETIFQLIQRLLYDIWKSPINLVLAIIILYLLVKLVIVKRRPTSSNQQKKTTIKLPKMSKCDLTVQELKGYNGIESNGRILTAIHGDIFDVSRRSDLYGTGGSYSLFAGRDATRALSKMQLDPSYFSDNYDDLSDLTDKERSTARSWHEDFLEKYDIVGHLLRPGEKPTVYPRENVNIDDDYSRGDKKRD